MLKSVSRAPKAPPHADSLSLPLSLSLFLSHFFFCCCCQELPAAVQAKAKVKNAQKADQNSHTCDSAVVSCSSFLLPGPAAFACAYGCGKACDAMRSTVWQETRMNFLHD